MYYRSRHRFTSVVSAKQVESNEGCLELQCRRSLSFCNPMRGDGQIMSEVMIGPCIQRKGDLPHSSLDLKKIENGCWRR